MESLASTANPADVVADILTQIDGVLYEDPANGAVKVKLVRDGDATPAGSDLADIAHALATVRLLADWVLVKLDDLPTMTASGTLHRPQRVADWTAFARVLAVGAGRRNDWGVLLETGLAVGDHVVFDWRPSNEETTARRLFGPRTMLLRADEIAGVVEAS